MDRQTDGQTDGIAVASTALAMRALRRAVKIEMLRRNGPVVKSVESVLRLEGSLWWERFVKKIGNTVEENSAFFSELIVLISINKGMQSLKLCFNKILKFITGGAS